MGAYIPFPGEQTLVPPGDCERTKFFYFLLPADHGRLRALCDRYFNEPSGGKCSYDPLGFVMLAFSHVDELRSSDPARGSIRYKDIALWVPVTGGKTSPICLFPPFIFVDEAATMLTGRELFGLPKQLGRFAMPLRYEDLPKAEKPEFKAQVAGSLFEGGPIDWRTLLTVSYLGSKEESALGKALSILGKLAVPDRLRVLDFPDWFSRLVAVPALGLKQFRDAQMPERACFQAIVEAPLAPKTLFGVPKVLLDAFELTIMNVPSHPVVETLGLSASTLRVPVSFYFEATMQMGPGTVIWSER
jgi:hypothetical protein